MPLIISLPEGLRPGATVIIVSCHFPSVLLSLAQGRPVWIDLSREAWHIGHAGHNRLSQHKHTEWKPWHQLYFTPRNNLKVNSMGWSWVLTDMLGPLWAVLCPCELIQTTRSECNWRMVALENTVTTTSDVVPGSCQLSKFGTVVATFISLFLVIKWVMLLTVQVCLQIPGWWCIKVWVPFFSKYWQSQYFHFMFATALTGLDFSCHSTKILQSTTDSHCMI